MDILALKSVFLYNSSYMQKIIISSWNVNGIRAVIRKGVFLEYIEKFQPTIFCLQETKALQEQAEIDLPEYREYWNSAEKKGYSGTAIFTREKPIRVFFELMHEDSKPMNLVDSEGRDANTEGRVITAEFEKFFLVNVYTPNAKDDLSRIPLRFTQWDPAFVTHLTMLEKIKPVITCGDFNVAHQEIDLARPKENEGKKGFTHEERQGFQNILDVGLLDSLRVIKGNEPNLYTWWSHWGNARERNVGWRIDYICVSKKLKKHIVNADIHPNIVGSDHCPVSVELSL